MPALLGAAAGLVLAAAASIAWGWHGGVGVIVGFAVLSTGFAWHVRRAQRAIRARYASLDDAHRLRVIVSLNEEDRAEVLAALCASDRARALAALRPLHAPGDGSDARE